MKNCYLLHTTTDKPIYKLKDTVYIRGVFLNALTQKPISKKETVLYESKCHIVGPKGDNIKSFDLKSCEDSTFAVQWPVPETSSGGNYIVKFESSIENFVSSERTFEVRAFQNPRLNTQLEFVKKGYTAGETVSATLNVKRAEGGYPNEGSIVKATSRIDGEETWSGEVKLDKTGNCLIKFDLPKTIENGEGTLIAVIQDGGVIETASKTIPIMREYIDCNVYPEGGDLVHGLECGLYVEAFTPQGEPADFSADILDNDEKVVGNIYTKHEGRGKTYFVPDSSKKYHLKVTRPTGIKRTIPLPKVQDHGVSLISLNDVYESNQDVQLKVSATKKGDYTATIFKKDQELKKVDLKLSDKVENLSFSLPKETISEGVLRVLIEEKGKPLAERLIFRKTADKINLEITSNYKSYSPGDSVKVTVKATNQKGEPVTAYTSISVVDESVLESVEKRKQAPRLPCMVFLEQEVDHLEDANLYFSDDQKADSAIDLLLGTQGWRRFKFIDQDKFISEKNVKAERALGVHRGKTMKEIEEERKPIILERNFNRRFFAMEQQNVQFNAPMKNLNAMVKNEELKVKPKMDKVAAIKAPNVPIMIKEKEVKEPQKNIQQNQKKEEQVRLVKKDMAPKMFAQAKRQEFLFDLQPPPEPEFKFERVYAFKKNPNRKLGDRSNFSETLYWSCVTKTNNKGEITFDFDLSDSVTSFRVIADSFSRKALFGYNSKLIESKEPFYIEPKVPLEVSSTDKILMPLGIVNSSNESFKASVSVNFSSKAITLENPDILKEKISLESNDRKRLVLDLLVGNSNEEVSMEIQGSAGVFGDKVTRPVKVVPHGFPMNISSSGLLEKDISMKFSIPSNVSPSSIVSNLQFMLTPAGTLQKAVESLMREPSGCFEQTSSSNYPLTMAHQYFLSVKADPEIITRSYGMLDRGYKRLISFECKNHGFEWFGSGDGHESLTSYGLLQFLEMSKFYPVDKTMLERTTKWLEGRKDKKGGFLRNSRALDSFGGAPEDITNAYIIYCLTECGVGDIKDEIEYIYKEASSKNDTYLIGLAAGALYNIGDKTRALELFKKLTESQQKDGSVLSSKTTITKSGGKSLIIETTAISILNWLNEKDYALNVENAMKWLLQQCSGGSFGNTQGTILSLKAIIKYEKMRAQSKEGTITVSINNEKFSKKLDGTTDTIIIEDFAKSISKPGDYTVSITTSDGLIVPYVLSVDYFSVKPDTSDNAKILLKTKLTETQMEEGSGAEIQVEVENIADEPQGMTMAIIGLPGGLEPRHEQLKELVKSEKIGFYEIRGRDVAIYLRTMKPKDTIKFKIDVIARIPGIYTGPSSRSYLYYTNEDKYWLDGLKVTIHPKDQVINVKEDEEVIVKKDEIIKVKEEISVKKVEETIRVKKETTKKGLFGSTSNTDDFDVKL